MTLVSLKTDRAARAVRVLDRNDSHRFWFRAATPPLLVGRDPLVSGQRSFHTPTQLFPQFSIGIAGLNGLHRRSPTAVVDLTCAMENSH